MRRAEQASGRRIVRCARCGRHRPHAACGYCSGCYSVMRRHQQRGTEPPDAGGRRPWTLEDERYLEMLLRDAGYTLQEAAEWLERNVWAVRRKAATMGLPLRGDHLLPRSKPRRYRMVDCSRCGRHRPHAAKGLCAPCYATERKRQRRQEARDE